MFSDVKVLIWDFDGTLYKPNPDLFRAVREAEYKTIMAHTGWDRDKATEEFNKNYKHVTPSATETVAVLTELTTTQAALEMENYFDRRDFLQRDQKLINMFARLRHFHHYMLANGVKRRLAETLVTLGLDTGIFKEIVTSEIVGVNKPHDDGFCYIIEKTGLRPEEHLMIGDREKVDLVPAKKLGMKTCLVFSEEKSTIADLVLPDVYALSTIFQ